jgi:hypothetical protein
MTGVRRIPRLLGKPLLDLGLGFALMRDRRVALRVKLLAVLAGLGITGVVEFLEIPVEGVLTMLLPVLGALGDVVLDGAEAVAGPLLLANVLLPFLAPKAIVEQVRSERAGFSGKAKGPIIDI